MNHNAFLKEFLSMRKDLSPAQPAIPKMAHEAALPKKDKSKKKSVLKPAPHVENGQLQHIIENKPPKKEVIEYLQDRANHYTVQKMA
jgi:hypothetical protein